MKNPEPFEKPIHIVYPIFPDHNDLMKKIEEIENSGQFTNFGIQHDLLEKKLKKYLNVNNLALFNNGTTALMVALKALNLTGEVITTPFTFPATTNALIWNNLTPVFCDIDDATFNIDVEKIEALITPKTSAILPVHIFGQPCNVEKIQKIATKHNLKVVYDAAQAFGVKYKEEAVCIYGDISMISLHATKSFNTIEGGCLICEDPGLMKKIKLLRNFGIDSEEILLPGINGKMNELQAAIGLLNIKKAQEETSKRKILDSTYRILLENNSNIIIKEIPPNIEPNYQYFPIRIKNRNSIKKELGKYNIFTKKYFNPLCSEYKYFEQVNLNPLEIANKISNEILALPLHGKLSVKDVTKICNILNFITNK